MQYKYYGTVLIIELLLNTYNSSTILLFFNLCLVVGKRRKFILHNNTRRLKQLPFANRLKPINNNMW